MVPALGLLVPSAAPGAAGATTQLEARAGCGPWCQNQVGASTRAGPGAIRRHPQEEASAQRPPSTPPAAGMGQLGAAEPRTRGSRRFCSLSAVRGHAGWRQTGPRAEVGGEGDIASAGAEGREADSGKEIERILDPGLHEPPLHVVQPPVLTSPLRLCPQTLTMGSVVSTRTYEKAT